jgi:dTDP-4-dehydrorhamnose reductase
VIRSFERNRDGIYNICGSERASRYEYALKTADVFSLDPGLISKVTSAELKQVAHRPLVTGFITLKAQTELGVSPMDLTQGLTLFKRELESLGRI